MRWPWQPKPETRDSGGDFYDAVLRAIEDQAAGNAADAGSTAAIEAAAGALSRAFASARVEGAPHVVKAVTGRFLGQVGRDLIRSGESMTVVDVSDSGRIELLTAASWHWEGDAPSRTQTVRVTFYGPSTSTTRNLPHEGVVFVTWGSTPGQPYVGTGPTSWAATTARLQSEVERSLADEAQNTPLAALITVPTDGGDGSDQDPLRLLKADIRTARGKGLFVETVATGYGEGRGGAPHRDFHPLRMGPAPPEALEKIRQGTFEAVLAATGTPPALFMGSSDGTSQRESVRRWHMGTVLPLARLLQDELAEKLEGECVLKFDSYPLDMVSRASVVDKLVRAQVPTAVALAAVGLDDG